MEKGQNNMTKSLLNLTLEIIYLLTGEDYTLVNKMSADKTTPNNDHCVNDGWSRNLSSMKVPSPLPQTPKSNNLKRILEVTQKIIELLTGEVPIRCQDVSVYFSMEEWEYIEGHKDLYKDIVMMEDQPPLTSPDGSSNRNSPERCPSPLYSQDYTQEDQDIPLDDQEIPQDGQVEDMIVIKAKVLENLVNLRNDEPCKEEQILPEISTDFENTKETQRDFRNDEEEKGHARIKEEDVPVEISSDGRYRRYKSNNCSVVSLNGGVEDDITNPLGENPIIANFQPVSQSPELSSNTSTHEGIIMDHVYPETYTICVAGEPIPCYVPKNIYSQGSKHNSQPTPDAMSSYSKSGKCFSQESSFARRAATKTYPCSDCGRCFSQKSNLLRHLRFHTVDKPYMCSACGRCFSQRSDLLRHQRIHTGEKPYLCLVCGRGFAQKSNLLRHHRSHSGERPFSCSVCGKCFAKKQDLVAHQTKHAS